MNHGDPLKILLALHFRRAAWSIQNDGVVMRANARRGYYESDDVSVSRKGFAVFSPPPVASTNLREWRGVTQVYPIEKGCFRDVVNYYYPQSTKL